MRDYHDKKQYQGTSSDQMLILLVAFMGWVFVQLLIGSF